MAAVGESLGHHSNVRRATVGVHRFGATSMGIGGYFTDVNGTVTGGDGQILDHSRTSNLGATCGATLRVMAGVEGTIGGGKPVYFRATDHVTEAHDRAPRQGVESHVRLMGDVRATYGATQSAVAGVAGTIGVGITAYVRTTYYVTKAHDRAKGQGA